MNDNNQDILENYLHQGQLKKGNQKLEMNRTIKNFRLHESTKYGEFQ